MFRHVSGTFISMAAILLFLAGNDLYGQEQSALNSFNQGQYALALGEFRTLMKSNENEAMYSYYAGRCLVELNESLDDAIELLYGASKKSAPPDAVFYLGMAYLRSYNFLDAQRCFEQFEMAATRQERKQYNVKHLIGTCRSAREITSSYNPFEVMNVTFMDLSDSLQYSQVKMNGGQLSPKPGLWTRGDEDPTGLSHLMFIPSDPVRGDYLYFALIDAIIDNYSDTLSILTRRFDAYESLILDQEKVAADSLYPRADAGNFQGLVVLNYFRDSLRDGDWRVIYSHG